MLDLPVDAFVWWHTRVLKLQGKKSAEYMNLNFVAIAAGMGSKDGNKVRKKIASEAFSG